MAYKKHLDTRCMYISVGVGAILAFVIGILIGRFATCPEEKSVDKHGVYLKGVSEALVKDGDESIGDEIINNIKSENIRENLRMLSRSPHLAGQEQNYILARKIKEHWENAGLDHVTLTPYNVLLSYPNMSDLNYVELLDERNKSKYKSDLREPVLTPEENDTHVVPPFNAYSAPGDIYGDLVYVNYGRIEDHEFLEKKGINISGKIAFARYGKIFRGDKVQLAEVRGAIGVILFSDPEDVTDGDITNVYPRDWWLPPSGTQRGTIYIGDGDPLTADYPAIETAYRKLDSQYYLPSIPCHPIGYGIAIHLMRQLGGDEVPADWRGGMNVSYRFGNIFRTPGWKAHIKVSTSSKSATIYNTIGVIRGNIEPDRYVLIGNHRDAWVFGALDPSSGTAVMMEIARAMGELVKSGRWRPRRSILFCSWGAEEYGLLGSTEWVEHYTKSLGARGVAYLNVDIAVEGNYSLEAAGTPLIFNALLKASKKVANPNEAEVAAGRKMAYDTWLKTTPSAKFNRPKNTIPPINPYPANPDREAFANSMEPDQTPSISDLALNCSPLSQYFCQIRKLKVSSYPMYHSAYETFYLVDKIMDRGFKCHRAVGQIWAEVARNLADSLILPFDVSDYSAVLKDLADTLLANFGKQMEDKGLATALLQTAVSNFTEAGENFKKRLETVNLNDPFVVRLINDQLMHLDRAFLDPAGLPGRRLKRHIILAESSVNSYSASSFPGLADALTEIRVGNNVKDQWEVVRKHFSVILFSMQSAAGTLKDVSDFMVDY